MNNKDGLKPLTNQERKFVEENYYLIIRFLKKSKLDAEEFFDIVVFDFILSVKKYLNNSKLQDKYSFETISYMYMKRAVFVYFRKQKAQKRRTQTGVDINFASVEMYICGYYTIENISMLEYREIIKQIESNLTQEQYMIFLYKLKGYSLKEIANNNGINSKHLYNQFSKIKRIVAEIMEV